MPNPLNNDAGGIIPQPTLIDTTPTFHEQAGLGLPAPIPSAPQYLIDNIVKAAPTPPPAETKPAGGK